MFWVTTTLDSWGSSQLLNCTLQLIQQSAESAVSVAAGPATATQTATLAVIIRIYNSLYPAAPIIRARAPSRCLLSVSLITPTAPVSDIKAVSLWFHIGSPFHFLPPWSFIALRSSFTFSRSTFHSFSTNLQNNSVKTITRRSLWFISKLNMKMMLA